VDVRPGHRVRRVRDRGGATARRRVPLPLPGRARRAHRSRPVRGRAPVREGLHRPGHRVPRGSGPHRRGARRRPPTARHTRTGPSLIGARHAVYSAHTRKAAKLKAVVETAPENLPGTTVHDQPDADGKRAGGEGKIFHFLLPGEGWLAAAWDTEIKRLAPEA